MLGFGTVRKSKTCILKKKAGFQSIVAKAMTPLYTKKALREPEPEMQKKKSIYSFLVLFFDPPLYIAVKFRSLHFLGCITLKIQLQTGGGVGEEVEYGGTNPLEVHNDPLQSLHLFQVVQSARPVNLVVTALLFPSFFSFPFSREIHKVSVYCTASESKHFKNTVNFFTAE